MEYEAQIGMLYQHLTNLEQLCHTYISYETSYNSLLLELERRRRYRDAAEETIRSMARELDTMRNGTYVVCYLERRLTILTSEEIQLRQSFFAEHGANLPEDLCTCVANMPTRWEVGPAPGEIREELPTIDKDLLDEVRVSVLFQNVSPTP